MISEGGGGSQRIKFGPGEEDYGALFNNEFGSNEVADMYNRLCEVEYRGEETGILRIGGGSRGPRTRNDSFAGGGPGSSVLAGPERPRVRVGEGGRGGGRGPIVGERPRLRGRASSSTTGIGTVSGPSKPRSRVRVGTKGASTGASGAVTVAGIISSASSSSSSGGRNDGDEGGGPNLLNDMVSEAPNKAYDAMKELADKAKEISNRAQVRAASSGTDFSFKRQLEEETMRKVRELYNSFKNIQNSFNEVADAAQSGSSFGTGAGGSFTGQAGGSTGSIGTASGGGGGVTASGSTVGGGSTSVLGGGGVLGSGTGGGVAGGTAAGGGAAATGTAAGGTAATGGTAVAGGAAGGAAATTGAAAGGTAAAGGAASGVAAGAAAGGGAAGGSAAGAAGALGSNPVGWAIAAGIAACCACIGVIVFFIASCSSVSMIQGIGDSFANGIGVGTELGTPKTYDEALKPNIPADNGYLAIASMYSDYRVYNEEFRKQLAQEVKNVLRPGQRILGCNYSYPDNADVAKYNIVINNYYNEDLVSKDSLGIFDSTVDSADSLLFRFSPRPPDFRQLVGIYYSLFETRMEKSSYEQIYSSSEIISPWTKNKISSDKITMQRLMNCLAKHEIKVTQKTTSAFNHGSHVHKIITYDVDVNIYIYDAVRVKGKDYTIAGEGNNFAATDVYEFVDPTKKGLLPNDISLRENLKDYITEVDVVIENEGTPITSPEKYITDYPEFELNKDGSFTMPSAAVGFNDSLFSDSIAGSRFLLLAISLQRRASTLNDSISQALTESNDWTTRYDSVDIVWPTKSINILNAFGLRTTAGVANYHLGMDITDTSDATVRAIADGTVIYSGFDSGGYGFCIIIEHKNTAGELWYSLYGHCNMILIPEAYEDIDGNMVYTTVTKGQKIALLGNTGYTPEPNLHLEIRTFDNAPENAVNPEFLFLNPGGPLPSAVPIPTDLPVFP